MKEGAETCQNGYEHEQIQNLFFLTMLLNFPDVKVCIIRTGKTKNSDKDFTDILQSRIENLTEVPSVGKSDIILVFCPVLSRAGTDIDKALERFTGKTGCLSLLSLLSNKYFYNSEYSGVPDILMVRTLDKFLV